MKATLALYMRNPLSDTERIQGCVLVAPVHFLTAPSPQTMLIPSPTDSETSWPLLLAALRITCAGEAGS